MGGQEESLRVTRMFMISFTKKVGFWIFATGFLDLIAALVGFYLFSLFIDTLIAVLCIIVGVYLVIKG